jgi:hypothetical protein
MAWLLPTVTAVLAVLVLALATLTFRLRSRLTAVEEALEARRSPSSDPFGMPFPVEDLPTGSLDDPGPARAAPTEYVITRVGEPAVEAEPEPVPTVPAPVFANLLLKETVVQTASLFQGLRRALAPETRNRIRFHMRQEVKRSRKQRKVEMREIRREWAARQRAAMPAEETPEGSAA